MKAEYSYSEVKVIPDQEWIAIADEARDQIARTINTMKQDLVDRK